MRALGDWLQITMSVLRVTVAGLLLLACLRDWSAARAWDELQALPRMNFKSEARMLIDQQRDSEAQLVIDAGLEGASPLEKYDLKQLGLQVQKQQDSLLAQAQQVGKGALTGTGTTAPALAGAVVADLFVFGDIRDLVIQGEHYATGQDVDRVIVALSAAGIALTAAPEADFGSSLLKFGRRTGALTEPLAAATVKTARRAVQTRDLAELRRMADDAAVLGNRARPAGAMTILKAIDSPEDLHLAAEMARQPGGAFSLWIGGRRSLDWLREGGPESQRLLRIAAWRGAAGLEFLAVRGRIAQRMHPLLGLLKGFYKGNLGALAGTWLREYSAALVGILGAWVVFEGLLLTLRLTRRWFSA